MALALTAIAASALLVGVAGSLETTTSNDQRTVALGLARQLMDEITGARYSALGVEYQTTFSPSSWEAAGPGRSRYDDIDDYDGLRIQPPEDLWGIPLGTDDGTGATRHPNFYAATGALDRWREEVDVYYVNPADPTTPLPAGAVSDYRAVEVRIVSVEDGGQTRELAKLRQVVAYVPPL